MPIFDYHGLAPSLITDLARMARAAYAGYTPPPGWSQVTGAELGGLFSGEAFSNNGAQAEIFRNGDTLVLAFRGTDNLLEDVQDYASLIDNSYLDNFNALFSALETYAGAHPEITNFHVTGHSLGAGAANSLREESATRAGGLFDNASYVTFASPIMSDNPDILNIGFENDWAFEALERLQGNPTDFASNTDHIVWYNDWAWFNDDANADPRSITEFVLQGDNYPHGSINIIEAVDRITGSEFYGQMSRDSIVVLAATDLPISAFGSGSTNALGPTFFLGQNTGDNISGTSFSDFMEGNQGNDLLKGNAGDDDIRGGAGNDEMDGGTGNDTIDGGNGRDTVYYTSASAGVNVDLSAGTASGGAGNDILRNVEDVIGSSGNDVLRGDAAGNMLVGLQGNDSMSGNGGDDTLIGAGGADTLVGGAGNDVLDARDSASSRMNGGAGEDSFIFSSFGGQHVVEDFQDGADFILIDTILAGQFDDVNISQQGADTMMSIGTLTLTVLNIQASAFDAGDVLLV